MSQRTGLDRGRRGLGPQGGGFRDAQRASELPRVRRPASPARRRPRRPASVDVACEKRPAWPSNSHPCAVLTARASTPPPGSSPSRGTEDPRADIRVGDMHALPWDDGAFAGGDELPRDLGDDPGGAGRGLAGATPRRPYRADGLGPSQGLAGRLGAHPVPAGSSAQGGPPGRDGSPRPARPGRGTPSSAAASWTCSGAPSRSRGSSPIPGPSRVRWRQPGRPTRPFSTSASLRSPKGRCRPLPLSCGRGCRLVRD